jgi:DNA-binding NtrC family response regulator
MTEKSKILFIDDEERILRTLKMLFRGRFDVFTTMEPEEAFELVRRERIDVIVSDQRMPKMFGAQVLARVKEISPNTMRILLTGYSDMDAAIEAVNQGEIFRYISKPWNPEDIVATVTEAAGIARDLVETANAAALDILPSMPNLLVIDDDPSTAALVRGIVGHETTVHHASSPEAAFEQLGRDDIGIVITELRVAGQDISAAIHQLKQYKPDVLSIALTSFTDTNALIDLINHGQVYRFLPKPANRALLERAIQATLAQHRKLVASPALARRHQPRRQEDSAMRNVPAGILGFIDRLRAQAQARIGR